MKVEKNITEFIAKRIEGKSFDEIAKEMNVAKSTLVDWNKKVEVREAIDQGKAFAINEVVRTYQQDKQARLKTLLELSNKINTELLKRDLTDISSDKLLQMSIANDSRVLKMIEKTVEVGEEETGIVKWVVGTGFLNSL